MNPSGAPVPRLHNWAPADTGAELEQQRTHDGSVTANPGFLLTIPEAAARLRISRSSVYRLFDAGELRWVRVCTSRRVSTAEINRFIAEHTEAAS
jgi:excisionase family DNA binding protein